MFPCRDLPARADSTDAIYPQVPTSFPHVSISLRSIAIQHPTQRPARDGRDAVSPTDPNTQSRTFPEGDLSYPDPALRRRTLIKQLGTLIKHLGLSPRRPHSPARSVVPASPSRVNPPIEIWNGLRDLSGRHAGELRAEAEGYEVYLGCTTKDGSGFSSTVVELMGACRRRRNAEHDSGVGQVTITSRLVSSPATVYTCHFLSVCEILAQGKRLLRSGVDFNLWDTWRNVRIGHQSYY